jgi:O-antigen ligase
LDLLIAAGLLLNLKLKLINGFLLFLLTNIAIVFLRIQNLFSFVIVDLLHKDLTFTGRTSAWDSAIIKISNKFLLGYGNMGQEQESRLIGDVYCHNALLEILFRGGIIRLIFFGLIILLISKKTNNYLDNRLFQNLVFCVCILWIISITESVLITSIIYVMFCGLYYLPQPVKKTVKVSESEIVNN